MRGHELGEDQHLQRRVAFLLLQLVDQLQQRLSLGIGSCGLGFPRQLQQHLDFGLLQLPAAGLHGQIHLGLAVQVRPLVGAGVLEQVGLRLRRIEQGLALFQCGADGCRTGRHQPLHQDHQEADVALLGHHGLVVAVAHIVGHGFVQALLRAVSGLPGHGLQPGHAGLEQRLPLGVDGHTLLGADHKGPHPVAADAAFIGESFAVQQLHQPHELVGLALVRRGRQ